MFLKSIKVLGRTSSCEYFKKIIWSLWFSYKYSFSSFYRKPWLPHSWVWRQYQWLHKCWTPLQPPRQGTRSPCWCWTSCRRPGQRSCWVQQSCKSRYQWQFNITDWRKQYCRQNFGCTCRSWWSGQGRSWTE